MYNNGNNQAQHLLPSLSNSHQPMHNPSSAPFSSPMDQPPHNMHHAPASRPPPRPKERYKKELESIAELLEKKFKQASPNELEYVNSQEAEELFMRGYSLFEEILQYSVTINSDTFRAWVLIQRWSGRMQRPEVLYGHIKHLGIHRPSFRLCASILTSYANGSYQLSKPEYVQWAVDSLAKMKEHNYVPNTYVYNALFVMCNKNQLYPEVWKFFIELMLSSDPSGSCNLDGFTCASLMETCVAEQNPQKGMAIYHMFRQLPASLKKNNEKYILQLKSKLDGIYEEQSRSFNFPALHERWKDYKPMHCGTTSQQKNGHNSNAEDHLTGPSNQKHNSSGSSSGAEAPTLGLSLSEFRNDGESKVMQQQSVSAPSLFNH